VLEFKGKERLEGVVTKNLQTGEVEEFHPRAAFVFIGLIPNTHFLGGKETLDDWDFVETDAMFQTSMPGVFAAGDMRAGSTKQLASAVGEGAAVLIQVRQYLQKLGEEPEKDAAA
jgi:thioredoxin reductase (NADPH)